MAPRKRTNFTLNLDEIFGQFPFPLFPQQTLESFHILVSKYFGDEKIKFGRLATHFVWGLFFPHC